MEFITSLIAFLVAIAILVAVHEWGHFIVARMMGVKVLRFSIGFGRPLWMKQFGPDQTEFCISAIPIGGYVKLLDERDCSVSLADQDRALNRKSIPARIAILFAGPGLNFVFAVLAYWCMFVIGVPGAKPVIGEVETNSIAAHAGLTSGDEITSVGNQPVATWEGAILAILDELLSEGDIRMTVQGSGESDQDVILQSAEEVTSLTEPGALFPGLGFRPWTPVLRPVIDELTPGGPAEISGLLPGDEILIADGIAVNSWTEWVEYVRARPGQTTEITVMRNAADKVPLTLEIGTAEADGETIGRIGAGVLIPPELYADVQSVQRYNLLQALPVAVDKTWQMAALTVRMVFSMVSGDVSVKNISGPINIAQYAGYSASIGFVPFVNFLAIVSISLGILNLLPIPMLDGGQILYSLVEAAKGAPLSERAQIIGQQMGIMFLLLLMSLAFYNDLSMIFG
jgi:regulator of sigma E protease